MKFADFKYERPDMNAIRESVLQQLEQFDNCKSANEQFKIIEAINKHRNDFDTMWNICMIRHSVDTTDEFYDKENDFFNEILPDFQDITHQFYVKVAGSAFKSELKEQLGQQFFNIVEHTVRTFHPSIKEDLVKENKLASEYQKLKASAKLEFDGKEYNLAGLDPLMEGKDRDVRRRASATAWSFYESNREKFDRIFDELVTTRNTIATKLGYDNFIALGYDRMLRTDYNAEKVAIFRDAVHKFIVPVAKKLRDRQTKRIGVDKLQYYDLKYNFGQGNAEPKGEPEWIVENAKKMYEELSPETGKFFNHMIENGLMDLLNKDGKAPGGYCTYLPEYQSPFIFSNFNGTSHDIDVLTHEAGHAFQVYESRNHKIPEYNWPTYEACEIHSMSMEFFTWPWMDHFFKEDAEKYKFSHLSGSLLFLPYGVAVDEFQHVIYANPEMTPAERKKAWRGLEDKYLPWTSYDENPFLDEGSFWQRQGHIYESPFYYIDYTLAQVCAFQFWQKSFKGSHEDAFEDYLKLCQAGGSQSFLNLVEYANLKSPFKESSIKEVTAHVEEYLEAVDDSAW